MVTKTRVRDYDQGIMSEARQTPGNGESVVQRISALFEPISYPVLRSLELKKVSVFYGRTCATKTRLKKNAKEMLSMTVASFKVCIERSRLENMHFLGKFEDIAPETNVGNLTSDHIEKFTRSIVSHENDTSVDPTVIEEALKGIKVPMSNLDPQARMMEFVNDFFERLGSVGYGDFK